MAYMSIFCFYFSVRLGAIVAGISGIVSSHLISPFNYSGLSFIGPEYRSNQEIKLNQISLDNGHCTFNANKIDCCLMFDSQSVEVVNLNNLTPFQRLIILPA